MYLITAKTFASGLPSQIKVGPIKYEIILASQPTAQIGEDTLPVYGMVNFRKAEITIADDLPVALAWQCYFHELLHIFFEHMGLEEPSEGQIDNLAYMLLGFMVDNGFLIEIDLPALESSMRTGHSERNVDPDGR